MNFLESVGLAFLIIVGLTLMDGLICLIYKYWDFIYRWFHTYVILDDDEAECPDFADYQLWKESLLHK